MSGVRERVTALLHQIEEGDGNAAAELFQVLQGELREIAGRLFRSQPGAHTLQPTALVNEAYLKFAASDTGGFQDRAHFCNAAARAMRQILVNHARDRQAQKRGGGEARERVTLSAVAVAGSASEGLDVLNLHEALERLHELDPRQAKIAELRVFADLGTSEIAELLKMPQRTVQLDWKMAKTWLMKFLQPDRGD